MTDPHGVAEWGITTHNHTTKTTRGTTMSVRTIAANGKPVSTKVLASSSGSTSWQSPVNYVDPLTGQRYEAPTLQDLLQTLDPQNGGPDLLDHA